MGFSQCFAGGRQILMEGGIGERLKREYGIKIDGPVAMASLVYDSRAREALAELWGGYADIAYRHNMPFIATTPTRRANKERILSAGYGPAIIKDNVEFLREVQKGFKTESYIGALMGCKGDAYTNDSPLGIDEAEEFHSYAAGLFGQTGVDFLYAGIMPGRDEALGMARAMSKTGLDYIISFMVTRDGRLIDGTAISDAIKFIDKNVSLKPICYMANCVHPENLYIALTREFNDRSVIMERFCGTQANTSPLSPKELDNCAELMTSDASGLADSMEKLKLCSGMKIWGGCCGTDFSHMEEIAKRV
ncbi:homocysteine S-methyltransferase family protein [Lachnospiraceae bacterium NSJ-143]|nr:homocysteine S-methyltransferase family protein [Lachnospiraceae bacterium NSJ-143]